MAQELSIQMSQFNGTDFDKLYPKTKATNVSGLTANRALVSNSSGNPAVSAVTSTELGYLDGVTSSVQTQLNGKQATITGGASTITSSNLTASRALVSNSSGKVTASAVTATELSYLDGVTSNVQTQLNGKQATITGGASTITSSNLTADRVLISNSSGKVAVSSFSSTELFILPNTIDNLRADIDDLAYFKTNPNLIINPFFEVNQRGQTSYHTPVTLDMVYTSDQYSEVEVVSSGGIAFYGRTTTQEGPFYLYTKVPNASKLIGSQVTISCLIDRISVHKAFFYIGSSSMVVTDELKNDGLNFFTITVPPNIINEDDDTLNVGIRVETTTTTTGSIKAWSLILKAWKLEVGNMQTLVDADTLELLPQHGSDYLTQLDKCRHYYQRIVVNGVYDFVANGIVTNGKKLCVIPTPFRELARTPTVTITGSLFIRDSAGYFTDASYSSPYSDFLVAPHYKNYGQLTIALSKQDGSVWGSSANNIPISLSFSNGTIIEVSCEL